MNSAPIDSYSELAHSMYSDKPELENEDKPVDLVQVGWDMIGNMFFSPKNYMEAINFLPLDLNTSQLKSYHAVQKSSKIKRAHSEMIKQEDLLLSPKKQVTIPAISYNPINMVKPVINIASLGYSGYTHYAPVNELRNK